MKIKIFPLVLAAMMIAGCSQSQNTPEAKNSGNHAVPVRTAAAEKELYTPVCEYSATAYASREANLAAVLPGRVEKIYVEEGAYVHSGDLIAELSDELLTQAEIEYKTLEKDMGRVTRLYKKGSLPEQDYDHLKARFDASKAKYELVRKNTEIRAPFNGTVTEKMLLEGESFMLINPGLTPGYSHASGIVRLMTLDPLTVRIEVNEKDLSWCRPGLEAEIVFDTWPEREFSGKLVDVSACLNPMTRTAEAEIMVANPDRIVKPGMSASVRLKRDRQEAVFVPLKAVYRQPGTGNDYVFTVDEDKAVRLPVIREFLDGDRVAVSGLREGTLVVTEGKARLTDGKPVVAAER